MTKEAIQVAAELMLPVCQYKNIADTTDDIIDKLFKTVPPDSTDAFSAHIKHLNALEIPDQKKKPIHFAETDSSNGELKQTIASSRDSRQDSSKTPLQLTGDELAFITKETIAVGQTGLEAQLGSYDLYQDKMWLSPTIDIPYQTSNTQKPGDILTRRNAEKYVEGFDFDVTPRLKETGGHVFINDHEDRITIELLFPFLSDGRYQNPEEFNSYLTELFSHSIGVIAQITPERLAEEYNHFYPDETVPLSDSVLNTFNHWLISLQTTPEHAMSSTEWRKKVTQVLFKCLRTRQPETITAMANKIKAF